MGEVDSAKGTSEVDSIQGMTNLDSRVEMATDLIIEMATDSTIERMVADLIRKKAVVEDSGRTWATRIASVALQWRIRATRITRLVITYHKKLTSNLIEIV